jgi:hypothetical protein
MLDDFFGLIYSWGHRHLIEIGLTLVFFLALHFVGYPFIIRRHDAATNVAPVIPVQASPLQKESPLQGIKTGDITTNGPQSGVYVGVEPPKPPVKLKGKQKP